MTKFYANIDWLLKTADKAKEKILFLERMEEGLAKVQSLRDMLDGNRENQIFPCNVGVIYDKCSKSIYEIGLEIQLTIDEQIEEFEEYDKQLFQTKIYYEKIMKGFFK
jgi:hypothetical protein